MPVNVFLEILEDDIVTGTTLEDSDTLEISVESEVNVAELQSTQFLEFWDGRGPSGPQGSPGPSGSHIEYIQATPAATWTWIHNLNTRPAVTLFLDSEPDELVYTDVSYPNLNTVVIEWPSAEAGKAYI